MIYNWLAVKATLMSKNKKELQKLPTYGQLLKISKTTMKAKNKVTATRGSLHCLALHFQTFRVRLRSQLTNRQKLFSALAKAKALAPCDLKIEAAFPVSADVEQSKTTRAVRSWIRFTNYSGPTYATPFILIIVDYSFDLSKKLIFT
ncbi:hypothetical protein T06_7664 [Trichinella sp. T6]|nr:hypothetical protein T06_7664 [Trichinella sp. T6]